MTEKFTEVLVIEKTGEGRGDGLTDAAVVLLGAEETVEDYERRRGGLAAGGRIMTGEAQGDGFDGGRVKTGSGNSAEGKDAGE